MSIARCVRCGPPSRKGSFYATMAEPIGHPDSGIICGVSGCQEPAVIWLTAWEAAEFRKGRRIFTLSGRAPKVRLTEVAHEVRPAQSGLGTHDMPDRQSCLASAPC